MLARAEHRRGADVSRGVRELINLQQEGRKAKVYQVRQVRQVTLRYTLESEKR